MAIKKFESKGGGTFAKATDYAAWLDAKALLVEVKGIRHKVASDYGAKDVADVSVTAFNTQAQLTGKDTPVVKANMSIDKTILVRDLDDEGLIGAGTVVQLAQIPNKKGDKPIWVWRNVDEDTESLVIAYAEERDAAINAAAEAAPGFDD